jgi:two-component system, NarL family, nitrate/nitrite response regulator NarL
MDATHERARRTPVRLPAGEDPAGIRGRPGAPETEGTALRTTVLVCADQHLVAATICAALGSRGIPTELVDWGATSETVPRVPRPRGRGVDGVDGRRVLLLVCDLDLPGRLGEARDLGRNYRLPWLVVDSLAPSPAWGALLEVGARAVVVSSIAVDDLVAAVHAVAHGETTFGELERRVLIRQWHEVRALPEHMFRQFHVVAEHDREILVMLYEGSTVRAVAERFGLSEAAVRAQVKAVLRRLALASHSADELW